MSSWGKLAVGSGIASVGLGVLLLVTNRPDTRFPVVPSPPVAVSPFPRNNTSMQGIIKTGQDLNITYCNNGLYLQADNGKILLIKTGADAQSAEMLTDTDLIDKQVLITGTYPAQELFCEALLCECEDYILTQEIKVLTKQY